jgi:hypothetical protein
MKRLSAAHLPGMVTFTESQHERSVTGEFTAMVHSAPTTTLTPVGLAGEMASIGFDLADSTAHFHAIATDPSAGAPERRAAARSAVERADDEVIRARHSMSDEGSGVAYLAVLCAQNDSALDSALVTYGEEEFEDGDEHLFGNDLAATLFDQDRNREYAARDREYLATPRPQTLTEDDLLAYDYGDPKRAVLQAELRATRSVEALAEAAGDEDPTYDPDDPYGIDLMDEADLTALVVSSSQGRPTVRRAA